MIRPGYAV